VPYQKSEVNPIETEKMSQEKVPLRYTLSRHEDRKRGRVAPTVAASGSRARAFTMSDENQHWVPKFLVKKFADRDGRVFCLDIHTDQITKPPPRQAASQKGFNDFKVGGETISFEDRLEKIETRAAPILKRMIDERQLTTLTAEDRRRVAAFVAAQSFRTKAFYEGL
jgi:Protein of unknown function (DUF4238)